jgi:hypothetical protein
MVVLLHMNFGVKSYKNLSSVQASDVTICKHAGSDGRHVRIQPIDLDIAII